MKNHFYVRSQVAKIFRSSEISAEMDEELRTHIAHRADDLEREGLRRAEAERRARIEFGARERYKEESYEALGGNFLASLVGDVRFGLRVLRKSPGFTIAAVLTLALGHRRQRRGLRRAERVVPAAAECASRAETLYHRQGKDKDSCSRIPITSTCVIATGVSMAWPPIRAHRRGWTRENPSRDGVRSQRQLLRCARHSAVSRPVLPASDEHGPNSAPYLVLSYAYWHSHFQNDPRVVGRVVQVNKHPFTILGCRAAGFPWDAAFFSPDFLCRCEPRAATGPEYPQRAGKQDLYALGHLRPGVTPAQARPI